MPHPPAPTIRRNAMSWLCFVAGLLVGVGIGGFAVCLCMAMRSEYPGIAGANKVSGKEN